MKFLYFLKFKDEKIITFFIGKLVCQKVLPFSINMVKLGIELKCNKSSSEISN